jgi:hypothetical protein
MDENRRDQRAEVVSADIYWFTDGSMLFGAVTARTGKMIYRVVAERLPNRDEWDWAVWRIGAIRCGTAPSVLSAIKAAQDTATLWASGIGISPGTRGSEGSQNAIFRRRRRR